MRWVPLLRATLALPMALAVASCYETATPLLDKGEQVALGGTYRCKGSIAGGAQTVRFSEESSGLFFFRSFRYIDADDGSPTLFKKLDSGLALGQTPSKQGRYQYAYFDFLSDQNFVILVADLMSKSGYIQPLLEKHQLAGNQNDKSVVLSGDPQATLAFLAAHDRSLLIPVMNCQREAQGAGGPPKRSAVPLGKGPGDRRAHERQQPSSALPEAPAIGNNEGLRAAMLAFDRWFDAAFFSDRLEFTRDGDVWTSNLDGTEPKQLTNWKSIGAKAVFSPEPRVDVDLPVRRVAYADAGGVCRIFDMANGHTTAPTPTGDCLSAAVSPDGKRVAMITVTQRLTAAEVEAIRATAGDSIRFGEELKPGVPKATRISVHDIDSGAELRSVAELPPPKARASATRGWQDAALFWRADSEMVYFVRGQVPDTYRLHEGDGFLDGDGYTLEVATGGVHPAKNSGGWPEAWAGNLLATTDHGSSMVLNTTDGNEWNTAGALRIVRLTADKVLALVDPDEPKCRLAWFDVHGKEFERIASCAPRSTARITDAMLSPTKTHVAYTTRCVTVPGCRHPPQLWLAPTAVGQERPRLLATLGPPSSAADKETWLSAGISSWSPDGKHITYTLGGSAWIAATDGSGTKKLAGAPGRRVREPITGVLSPQSAKVIAALTAGAVVLLALFAAFAGGRTILRRMRQTPAPTPSDPPLDVQPETVFCTECGASQCADYTFCTACGHRRTD